MTILCWDFSRNNAIFGVMYELPKSVHESFAFYVSTVEGKDTTVYRDKYSPVMFDSRDVALKFAEENKDATPSEWIDRYGEWRLSRGWEWNGIKPTNAAA